MDKFALIADNTPKAQNAIREITQKYQRLIDNDADIAIILGGDGFMLENMRLNINHPTRKIYGMNCGRLGFLMNDYIIDDLPERIAIAIEHIITPLQLNAIDDDGNQHRALALNEIVVHRDGYQAVDLSISINDGSAGIEQLIGDGIIIATEVGSTGYNLSAMGPIIPIGSNLIALTPICPFRPRRWRGALLEHHAHIHIDVNQHPKRRAHVVADSQQFNNINHVDIAKDHNSTVCVLYNQDHSLHDRALKEQFQY